MTSFTPSTNQVPAGWLLATIGALALLALLLGYGVPLLLGGAM
jgi:hypothetical protein